MANALQVCMQQGIIELYERGLSNREIGLTLRLNHRMVSRYLRMKEVSMVQSAPPPAHQDFELAARVRDRAKRFTIQNNELTSLRPLTPDVLRKIINEAFDSEDLKNEFRCLLKSLPSPPPKIHMSQSIKARGASV